MMVGLQVKFAPEDGCSVEVVFVAKSWKLEVACRGGRLVDHRVRV